MTVACMGGWCKLREDCANYHAEGDEPSERLCESGADGRGSGHMVVIRRPVGTWEAHGQRQQPAARQ
jgi:hypothetical protein